MKDWRKIALLSSVSIHDAIKLLNSTAMQICLVVDEQDRLQGTVTDGDIRRAILKNIPLSESVVAVMNPHPVVAREATPKEEILAVMKRKLLHHVPVVGADNKVLCLQVIEDFLQEPASRENYVVLMAGGEGRRLRPLTDNCPKPLLKIGAKTIMELILDSYREQGFKKFIVSVNYRADMIRNFFGDGSRYGVSIEYLQETQKMGTAGALSLLPKNIKEPFFVMNCDLLTTVNFQQILQFHKEQRAKATMGIRQYSFQVPYGVVNTADHRIESLDEKPVHNFFINAGIYIIEPEILNLIPENRYFDMTDLFKDLLEKRMETSAFPIHEYWIDIGHKSDLEKALNEYDQLVVS